MILKTFLHSRNMILDSYKAQKIQWGKIQIHHQLEEASIIGEDHKILVNRGFNMVRIPIKITLFQMQINYSHMVFKNLIFKIRIMGVFTSNKIEK